MGLLVVGGCVGGSVGGSVGGCVLACTGAAVVVEDDEVELDVAASAGACLTGRSIELQSTQ